jgi:hypothetical protein
MTRSVGVGSSGRSLWRARRVRVEGACSVVFVTMSCVCGVGG